MYLFENCLIKGFWIIIFGVAGKTPHSISITAAKSRNILFIGK
jgi:hypothetical protein